ncbi:hypothetical protein I7I53_09210 [Histoplasma capsulatum var. duboisii H88]|uniref:Uncharacterized protein n=1 Tax=Ajellomyces capsulatus (strain H88) TaxID=544711 RepID=A0A8A1L966_AJEC8|nr:hypothetical protein I7I53_09210 [Histoplasma capsulatum var. duboisii H88]
MFILLLGNSSPSFSFVYYLLILRCRFSALRPSICFLKSGSGRQVQWRMADTMNKSFEQRREKRNEHGQSTKLSSEV